MSRSSTLVSNPAIRTLKFKGEKFNKKTKEIDQEAGWYWWNKEGNNGEGENVLEPIPIKFFWLESAQSFTGYNSKTEKGLYSNEILPSFDAVKKYGKKELELKSDGETLLKGYYKDIKEEAKGFGAKFCIPVYAAMEIDGEFEIIRFLMTGASGSAWMQFNKDSKNLTNAIVCYDTIDMDMKTGDTYKAPLFKYVPATDEEISKCDELVKKIDDYFDYILSDEPENDADY